VATFVNKYISFPKQGTYVGTDFCLALHTVLRSFGVCRMVLLDTFFLSV